MPTNPKLKNVLESIGLQEIMIDRDNEPAFDHEQFHCYTPSDYLSSENKDRDAVHRMSEEVLLHKATGLRVRYLVTESYYGDEYRYRAVEAFVLTNAGERLTVLNIDLSQNSITIDNGIISLNAVDAHLHFR